MLSLFKHIAVLALAIVPTYALSAPFGIEPGSRLSSLKTIDDDTGPFYTVSPPTPHPLFATYSVLYTPEEGVCAIRAIGELVDDDRYGNELKSKFQQVKSALDKKYGTGTMNDRLLQGALWSEVNEFMMAIKKNERIFQAEWATTTSDSDDLRDIIISIVSISSDSGALSLQYRFLNYDACQETIKRSQDSAF